MGESMTSKRLIAKFQPANLAPNKLKLITEWLKTDNTKKEYPNLDHERLIDNLCKQAMTYLRISDIRNNYDLVQKFIQRTKTKSLTIAQTLDLWLAVKNKQRLLGRLNFHAQSIAALKRLTKANLKYKVKLRGKFYERNIDPTRFDFQKAIIIGGILETLKSDYEFLGINKRKIGKKFRHIRIDELKAELVKTLRDGQKMRSFKTLLSDAVELAWACNPNFRAKKDSGRTLQRLFQEFNK